MISSIGVVAPKNYNIDIRALDNGERRRIKADFAPIKAIIIKTEETDNRTHILKQWCTSFSEALNSNSDARKIQSVYISILQDYLRDPFGTPLDEEALLGTDGHTYSRMSLTRFMNDPKIPEHLKNRSPLNLNDPRILETRPHELVRRLIDWLKSHNAYQVSMDEKKAFEQIPEEKKASGIPLTTLEKIRIIKAKEQALRAERKEKMNAAAFEHIGPMLNHRRMKANLVLRYLQEEQTKEFQLLHQQIDQIEQDQKSLINQLQAYADKLNKGLNELEENNKQLDLQLNSAGAHLSEGKREVIQMQKNLNKIKEEIEKEKKRNLTKIFITVGIIGGCMFGTWALTSLLASSGSGVAGALLPAADGASIAISIPLPL